MHDAVLMSHMTVSFTANVTLLYCNVGCYNH